MKERSVVLALFTDGEHVVVQERGRYSKVGEKYGFIGGGMEEGETKEEAIKRELQEELGFVPEKLEYALTYHFIIKEKGDWEGANINEIIFLSPITNEVENAKITEGVGLLKLRVDEIIKGDGFPDGSTKFLKDLKKTGRLYLK